MKNSCDTATEILQLLRAESPSPERLRAALSAAVLGYGDLSDRSDPRQVADDVLLTVRSALLDQAASPEATHLRRVG